MFNVTIPKDTLKTSLEKSTRQIEDAYIKDSVLKFYEKKYKKLQRSRDLLLKDVCVVPNIDDFSNEKQKAEEEQVPAIIQKRKLHSYENLNEKQAAIFDYVTGENRYGITLVQAGPGTGKTFTMLTIANHFIKNKDCANVVIYKNDLVDLYRYCAHGYSLAKFMMRIFDIKFGEYLSLEKTLCRSMSIEHFTNIILQLLCRVRLITPYDDFYNYLLILDEYTVIPKPFLLVILLVLERYKIGAVICGDRNQLQNIHNTKHAGNGSSYDFVKLMAQKELELTKNHRCQDLDYNKKVEILSWYSSSDLLDDWGKALIGAIFYKNLLKTIDLSDTILASEHRDLSVHLDMMVKKNYNEVVEAMWYIEQVSSKPVNGIELTPNSMLFYPNPTVRYGKEIIRVNATDKITGIITLEGKRLNNENCPGKFLPYIPLIIGQTYFVDKYSELFLAILEKISFDDTGNLRQLEMRMLNTQKVIDVVKNNECNKVMFDKHVIYLLNNGKDFLKKGEHLRGKLYNFPIYPAFQMSIYMCQGRTVSGVVSFIFKRATYQALYVAASRITSHKNVNAVIMSNAPNLLFTTVMNFNTSSETGIPSEEIISKFVDNPYRLYEMPHNQQLIKSVILCVTDPDINVRRLERQKVLNIASKLNVNYTLIAPKQKADDNVDPTLNATIGYIVRYRKTMNALTCITNLLDRHLWQRMFFIKMMDNLFENIKASRYTSSSDHRDNVLTNICEFNSENLMIDENHDMKTFIKNNLNVIYSDANRQMPANVLPVDDNLNILTNLKARVPYKCINKFTWNLMTTIDLDLPKETVCEQLYKLLSEELESNSKEIKRKTSAFDFNFAPKAKKLKIVPL